MKRTISKMWPEHGVFWHASLVYTFTPLVAIRCPLYKIAPALAVGETTKPISHEIWDFLEKVYLHEENDDKALEIVSEISFTNSFKIIANPQISLRSGSFCLMWIKQFHKPSPSAHHVYRCYGYHSQSRVVYGIV